MGDDIEPDDDEWIYDIEDECPSCGELPCMECGGCVCGGCACEDEDDFCIPDDEE